MNKELRLPRKGRLIVVTDLHGNYDDYQKYLKLWNKDDKDSHIVFVGDLIHSTFGQDQSIEIMDDIIEKTEKYDNFHILLGNHEWAHITNRNIYKSGKNQKTDFEKLIETKKGNIQPTLDNYIKFFKSLPYFLKTDNGLFISHAGPSKNIKTIEDYKNLLNDNHENQLLDEFLWNRPGDYTQKDVENFLKIINSNCMIIGHNNVDGFKKIGRQIIIASSHMTDNKTYFNIDLSQTINNMNELTDYMKFLE